MEEPITKTATIRLEIYKQGDRTLSCSTYEEGEEETLMLGLVSNPKLLNIAFMAAAYMMAENDDIENGVASLRELAESMIEDKKNQYNKRQNH